MPADTDAEVIERVRREPHSYAEQVLLRLLDEREAALKRAQMRWHAAVEMGALADRDHATALTAAAQAARNAALDELTAWHSQKMDGSIDMASLDIEHHWRCSVHSESIDYIRSLSTKGDGT